MNTVISNAANPYTLNRHADSAYALPVSHLVDLSGNEDFYLFSGSKHNRTFDRVATRLRHAEGPSPAVVETPFIWDGSIWIDPTDSSQTEEVKKKKHWVLVGITIIVVAAAIKTLFS